MGFRWQVLETLGPLPKDTTPLHVNVTGTVEYQGVTIQKLLFQSRPSFYVTAALFFKTGTLDTAAPNSVPAVLYASGHEQWAFRCAASVPSLRGRKVRRSV